MSTPDAAAATKAVGTESVNQPSLMESDIESDARAAASLPTKPQRMLMDLAKLVQHPLQAVFNPPCSQAEGEQLDADLAANGQRDPIHVMPPGNSAGLPAYALVDGHRRAASLGRLGKTSALVLVRWDLLDADATTVEATFLRFNQIRRQLDPLSVAKNVKRQKELENGGRLGREELRALDRTISNMLGGMGIRNVQRYLHAVAAPLEIQSAFRRGDINLTAAAQVGAFDADVQQEVVEAIKGITDRNEIREIIKTYIKKYGAQPGRPLFTTFTPRAVRLIRDFEDRLAELDGHYPQLHGPALAQHRPALNEIQKAVAKLIAASKRPGGDVRDLRDIFGHEKDSDAAGK